MRLSHDDEIPGNVILNASKNPVLMYIKGVDILKLKDTLVCGPGSCMLDDLRQPGILSSLSAEYIAKHAYNIYQKNEFTDPEKFTPLYVREFQPKMKRKDLDI